MLLSCELHHRKADTERERKGAAQTAYYLTVASLIHMWILMTEHCGYCELEEVGIKPLILSDKHHNTKSSTLVLFITLLWLLF